MFEKYKPCVVTALSLTWLVVNQFIQAQGWSDPMPIITNGYVSHPSTIKVPHRISSSQYLAYEKLVNDRSTIWLSNLDSLDNVLPIRIFPQDETDSSEGFNPKLLESLLVWEAYLSDGSDAIMSTSIDHLNDVYYDTIPLVSNVDHYSISIGTLFNEDYFFEACTWSNSDTIYFSNRIGGWWGEPFPILVSDTPIHPQISMTPADNEALCEWHIMWEQSDSIMCHNVFADSTFKLSENLIAQNPKFHIDSDLILYGITFEATDGSGTHIYSTGSDWGQLVWDSLELLISGVGSQYNFVSARYPVPVRTFPYIVSAYIHDNGTNSYIMAIQYPYGMDYVIASDLTIQCHNLVIGYSAHTERNFMRTWLLWEKHTDTTSTIWGCYYDDWLGGTDSHNNIVNTFSLKQNYPNPFNPISTIQYQLPQRSDVQITIYDLLGREVTTLVSETQEAGFKSVQWNATNDKGQPVSTGVYFYRIQAGDFVNTKKCLLIK